MLCRRHAEWTLFLIDATILNDVTALRSPLKTIDCQNISIPFLFALKQNGTTASFKMHAAEYVKFRSGSIKHKVNRLSRTQSLFDLRKANTVRHLYLIHFYL